MGIKVEDLLSKRLGCDEHAQRRPAEQFQSAQQANQSADRSDRSDHVTDPGEQHLLALILRTSLPSVWDS